MSQTTQYLERQIVKTVAFHYWLHVPTMSQPGTAYPLILFLHGAGERGDNLDLVKVHGIPKIVESQPDLPFITIAPQCPLDSSWPFELDVLEALMDDVLANLPVDPARCYLTGLSMGGYGTWALAAQCPERWAAIAPICGGGSWLNGFPQRVLRLVNLPVWAFHGAKDPVVPLAESQHLVDALVAGGGDARLTVYPEAGHDSWSETYANPELYQWFLAHQR
ncbi:MAG: carboxylesterase family protein [Anaerolineae bacterium]